MLNKIISLFDDRHFVIYAIIGVSGVIIDFLLYLLLVSLGVPAVIASVISVSVGIINNFILNANFNFRKKDHYWRRFITFFAVGLTGVCLSALFIVVFHNIFKFDDILAKLISVPFIVLFQFWFNKNSSFAHDPKIIPYRELAIFFISLTAVITILLVSPYGQFSDEMDNILGAKLIAEGGLIYKDYFSHHMPLVYFVTAPLLAVFGTDLIAVKVAFGLGMSIWLLAMSRHLLSAYGLSTYASFLGLVTLSLIPNWSHMILAESISAFAVAHALIIFITQYNTKFSFRKVGLPLALLGAIPALSTASFAPISLFIYALVGISIIKSQEPSLVKVKQFLYIGSLANLPYLTFLIYLGFTRSLGEFIQQGIKFNSNYYSQFTSDAPRSLLDGIISVPQGTFTSVHNVLTFSPEVSEPVMAFIFLTAIVSSLYVLYIQKNIVVLILFSTGLILAGARGGFATVFSQGGSARLSSILFIIAALLIVYTFYSLRSARKSYLLHNLVLGLFSVYFISMSLNSLLTSIRSYQLPGTQARSQTIAPDRYGNDTAAGIFNIVNNRNDYYWTGPLDFTSQIYTKSENASIYRFYLPWHAACEYCTSELINDLGEKSPNVISYGLEGEIWGIGIDEYSNLIPKLLDEKYYQVEDRRLHHYFFLVSNKDEINERLSRSGFSIKEKIGEK